MSKPKQSLEEVTLLKDHTHRGEKKRAGGKIRVNAVEREWLEAHSVIARASVPAAAEPATK